MGGTHEAPPGLEHRPRGMMASEGGVPVRLGLIGAGSMGGILARHFAGLGHHVSVANSRGPESLTALAAEIGATPVSLAEAARAGAVVVIATPTKAVADLPRGLFANVADSVVVIDIGNYHPELRDGRIEAIDRGMLDSQGRAADRASRDQGVQQHSRHKPSRKARSEENEVTNRAPGRRR